MSVDKNPSCPGCGLVGGDSTLAAETGCNASSYCWAIYQEFTVHTFSLGDADFFHQHVIDIYTSQHSSLKLKGIQICFALAGLYLYLEHNYSGKAIQQAHRLMAEKTKDWPKLLHEEPVVTITIQDVVSAASWSKRFETTHSWAQTVWQAWQPEHQRIVEVCDRLLDL